jgi:propionate CoA-transferase
VDTVMPALMPSILSADEMVDLIPDGATVALTGSGGGILEADVIFAAVEKRFLATGSPRGLTLVHGLGIGDGETTGLNRFAHEGLVSCVIGGHWSWSPRMQRLATVGAIEAYSLPAGVIAALLRESGAHRPGLFTKVGIGTFVDPRHEGGRLNDRSRRSLVSVATVDGEEYLHYKPLRVDVAIVRGSSVDGGNNLSVEREAASLDSLAVAAAAKGNAGVVLAQAKELVPTGVQDPRIVSVPGFLVDAVVLAPGQWQSYLAEYEPALVGGVPHEARVRPDERGVVGVRDIVARRAALEVPDGAVLNVGFGMSAGVVDALRRDGRLDRVKVAIEQGPAGGEPENGVLFGLSRHPGAVIASTSMFDLFATGVLDVAVLGMAECDGRGNVNVSKVGDAVVGPGGFIDIATAARKIVFTSSFTARGLQAHGEQGRLEIEQEGTTPKFVETVSHLTFSAAQARARGQEVVYVTERAVFRLGDCGLELVEVAPGIDIERDVLAHMAVPPLIESPTTMPDLVLRAHRTARVDGAEVVRPSRPALGRPDTSAQRA